MSETSPSTKDTQTLHPFIEHLHALGARKDRRALAELRRGLGHPPGTIAEAYRHVIPWLPNDCKSWEEQAYYLVATLFAMHPQANGKESIGGALRLVKQATGSESIEARFVALLNAHPDDVAEHLRHLLSLIRSKSIAIDYNRLFEDLRHLRDESGWIQKRWAKDFWQEDKSAESTENPRETEGSQA